MSRSIRKVRVRKTDPLRALLTETLPYEVPMLFSNEGFYLRKRKGSLEGFDGRHGLGIFDWHTTVPYRYKIRKNAYEFRGLSIMHPSQQLKLSDFYQAYDHLMVGLCQRSPFTLRAPSAIASYFVERVRASRPLPMPEKAVEEGTDGFAAVPPIATSYFVYSNYRFMFKFYDSVEFVELEKRFSRLSKLDISDCFNRIYTHTIAWAVKSKNHAKKNTFAKSFEVEFDKIMQNANHGETAGILIGPEVSRIFAEIILQRIDLDIKKKADELELEHGMDYAIRRYVDDYFIYTSSEAICLEIKKIIGECLAEYKLAINSAKAVDHLRPFVTGPSISRHNISTNIKEFFDKNRRIERVKNEDQSSSYKVIINSVNSEKTANQVISAIKRSIGESGSYDASANYFFGTIKKLLQGLIGRPISSESGLAEERLYRFLLALVDVVFFYYSMTPRMRQTYLTTEILLMVMKLINSAPDELKDALVRKIVHEARLVVTQGGADRSSFKIELMNLLIVLRGFGEKYIFDEGAICQVFNISQPGSKMYKFGHNVDYFQAMFLLSYLGGVAQFESIVRAAIANCIEKFSDIEWSQKSECVFMFFDLMSCPYMLQGEKTTLAKYVLQHKSLNNINARASALVEEISTGHWFFAWGDQADLALVLKKKELRTPY